MRHRARALLLIASALAILVLTVRADPSPSRTGAVGIRSDALLAGRAHGIASGPPGSCGPAWQVVDNPEAFQNANFLRGVSVLSANDAWAVGAVDKKPYATLIEHWDGSSWTLASSPNVGEGPNYLYGVDGASVDDVWAVGAYKDVDTRTIRTLILHYDGTGWSVVVSPNGSLGDNYLTGVVAVSPTDVWAVGYREDVNMNALTLLLHYDGLEWSVIPSPNPGPSGNFLYGVAATSASDVWAVGYGYDPDAGNLQTLVVHYDGAEWTSVPSPSLSPDTANLLLGVAAASPTSAWAVGFANGTDRFDEIVLHWDGSAWTVADDAGVSGRLLSVAAVAPDDVWAVGNVDEGAELIEHWDGRQWSVIAGPPDGMDVLSGISALPGGRIHAVGHARPPREGISSTTERLCEAVVTDTGFAVDRGVVGLGTTAAWTFPSSNLQNHRVVSQGLGLFDSGARPPGSSYTFTFQAAGTYAVTDPPSRDQMRIQVAPTAVPLQGNESTQFNITWAKAAIPGFVFDVQVRRPGLGWEDWKVDVTTLSGTFLADAGTGQYSFRARIQNVSNSRTSAYSHRVTITVT
jgi:plastocyanin